MKLTKQLSFGAPAPSEMLFAYNTKTVFAHPLLPLAKAKKLNDLDKVSFCAEVVAFARTYFSERGASES